MVRGVVSENESERVNPLNNWFQAATHSGSVETGKWYDVKLTVAGDSVKAWLDDELVFDEVLKQINN